jgi:hypothetical protein
MTKVRGRPFYFGSDIVVENLELPSGFFGRWTCKSIANQNWKNNEN